MLSRLSPATYVLDGVRAGLLDGVPVTALWYDIVPLVIMGIVLIPAGLWAFGRAERYAKRTGKLKRVGDGDDPPRPHPASTSAGTRAGPPPSCRSTRRGGGPPGSWPPTATPGSSPARPVTATPSMSGRLRHEAMGPADLPAVGDWVAATGLDDPASTTRRPGRRCRGATAFTRNTGGDAANLLGEQVMAANVDVAFVVAGLDGDFNLRRLERYLAVAWAGGATPIVLLNKADVAADVEGLRVAAEAVAPGSRSGPCPPSPATAIAALAADHLGAGRTAVVLGSSGVGKSTLVNALVGSERLRTGAVREDDSRGRHTTTHRELVRLPGGALLIDTPGIRSLGVAGAGDGLEDAFSDIAELAASCRFTDCRHETEPGCAVQAALADGRLDRRAVRQPPQARARGGPRRPRERPAPPGRGAPQVEARSTCPSTSTCSTSTGATDDHADERLAARRHRRHGRHVPPLARPRRDPGHGRRQQRASATRAGSSSRSTSRACAIATRTS